MSIILSPGCRNFVEFEKDVRDVFLASFRFVDKVRRTTP
jgi:hypothetical protein